MKFLLLVTFLNYAEPNFIYSHYDTYSQCVADFSKIDSPHPIQLICSEQAEFFALVVHNLDTDEHTQHSVHYSLNNCNVSSRELSFNYSYKAYCTQYE